MTKLQKINNMRPDRKSGDVLNSTIIFSQMTGSSRNSFAIMYRYLILYRNYRLSRSGSLEISLRVLVELLKIFNHQFLESLALQLKGVPEKLNRNPAQRASKLQRHKIEPITKSLQKSRAVLVTAL